MKDIRELTSQTIMDELSAVSIREACPECKRGAVRLPMPDLGDLGSLLEIKEGFDRYRRNFTPEMAAKMESMNRVIAYLHAMIAGTHAE